MGEIDPLIWAKLSWNFAHIQARFWLTFCVILGDSKMTI